MLFVKMADPLRSQGRDLNAEAALYRLARDSGVLRSVTPECLHISRDASTIVLEAVLGPHLLPGGTTSQSANDRRDMVRYGAAVAAVHSLGPPGFGVEPWLLTSLEPVWAGYPWLPEQCARFLQRLSASPFFREMLSYLQQSWRRSALLHGDLRWSNILLDPAVDRLYLVDWELAGAGDPAWDIGAVISDLLVLSVLGPAAPMEPSRLIDLTASFLEGYRTAEYRRDDIAGELVRSIRYAAVHLIRTILEHGYSNSGEMARAEILLIPWAASFLEDAEAFTAAMETALAHPSSRVT
jgi:Ser/Thr protein kinase RdoA (MazF antagonist)